MPLPCLAGLGLGEKARRLTSGTWVMAIAAWLGIWAALGVSLLGGLALYWLAGGLSGVALEAYEGLTKLTAAVILTGMIITMQRLARNLKGELQGRVDQALASGSRWGQSDTNISSSMSRKGVKVWRESR